MGRTSKKDMIEALSQYFKMQGDEMTVKQIADKQFALCAKEDTELTMGRVAVGTGCTLNGGFRGVITSLVDNIQNGLKVNDGIRLENSEVIPYVVRENEAVCVYVKVNDTTLYTTHEGLGVRTKVCYIPKGLPIATLTLI